MIQSKKKSGLSGVSVLLALAVLALFNCRTAVAQEGDANIYNFEVQPLELADCARCHKAHFDWLRTSGAKHQGVACTECHEIFHAYNPLRNNYAEIMPKCAQCHDLPHGAAEPVSQCLNCHTNPHQPLASIPDPANLEPNCRLCHTVVAASLQAEVSKHTEQECSSCHSQKHGRIPACFECHENHSPLAALDVPDCLKCHPVHTPLRISYPADQAKEVCAGCHETAYNLLSDRITRHSAFSCAKCHPQHGHLPVCMDCHGKPHNPAIHEKYALCGDCHGIAHDVARP